MSHLIQVVTDTFDPVSAAIRIETHSWASHAEFVDAATGVTLGAHALGGVKIRPYQPDRYRQVRRYTAPFIELAFQAASSQIGKPYDFSAILGIAFNRNWRDRRRWFCSELVAWAFEQTESPLFNREIANWAIWPRDIPMSLMLERVL
jgi:hypothetical protein